MTDAIVNGILLGGLYTTVALGLSLVFGVMRLVNLAHGEMLTGGAYLVFFLTSTLGVHIDPLLACLVVAPAMFVIAYLIQSSVLTPLLRHGLEAPLVATFGISVVLQALYVQGFSGDSRSLRAPYDAAGTSVLGVEVRVVYIIALGIGVSLVVLTHLALTRTRAGRALRAASTDAETAATMGIDVRRLYGAALGIAAIMATVGGVLIGAAFAITPTTGTAYLIKGFAVVVLGGLGSLGGTLAGGLAIGLADSVGAQVFGGAYRDLVVYGLLILVLAIRPSGLFGGTVAE